MAILRDPEGRPIGFICGRGRQQPKRCAYCHRDSSKLCDAMVDSGQRAGKTCDVPMCHLHTFSPHVDVDYCRDHLPQIKEKTNGNA